MASNKKKRVPEFIADNRLVGTSKKTFISINKIIPDMTKAEEKAKELVDIYFKCLGGINKIQDDSQYQKAKQCALIAVDEILKAEPTNPFDGLYYETYSDFLDEVAGFWKDVKKALEHNG